MDPVSMSAMLSGLGGLGGALGGGGTKVSQSVANSSSSLLSLSNVVSLGGGSINSTPSGTSSQTPSSTTATNADPVSGSGYGGYDAPLTDYSPSVTTAPVDGGMLDSNLLMWGGAAVAAVIALPFIFKTRR